MALASNGKLCFGSTQDAKNLGHIVRSPWRDDTVRAQSCLLRPKVWIPKSVLEQLKEYEAGFTRHTIRFIYILRALGPEKIVREFGR